MSLLAFYARYQCTRCDEVDRFAVGETLVTTRQQLEAVPTPMVPLRYGCLCGADKALLRRAAPRKGQFRGDARVTPNLRVSGQHTTRTWHQLSFWDEAKGRQWPDFTKYGLLRMLSHEPALAPELKKVWPPTPAADELASASSAVAPPPAAPARPCP